MSPKRTRRFDDATLQVNGTNPECEDLSVLIATGAAVYSRRLPVSGSIVLGRDDTCDWSIDDHTVSRRHARILAGSPPQVEDLGSTNGTRYGGLALSPGEPCPLAVGGVIELGATVALVQRAAIVLPAPGVSEPEPEPEPRQDEASIVMRDPVMRESYALLDAIAPSSLSVLILGETGVGKEVFASAIHARSRRANSPFVRINCAAVAQSVLESELFGYERGAFTGAVGRKIGLLESANGGTVFLDEVGELALTTQAKLLRFLESGEVLRVGAVKSTYVDVRILSATNRDLVSLIATGGFRPDLFYRLNGISITVPPLRDRPDDLEPLAELFIARACAQGGRQKLSVTPELKKALHAHSWPGNVRELRHALHRAVVLCRSSEIDPRDLRLEEKIVEPHSHFEPTATGLFSAVSTEHNERPGRASTPREIARRHVAMQGVAEPADTAERLPAEMERYERQRIVDALEKCAGNQSRAAELLGITRRVLMSRLDAYGITRPRKRRQLDG